MSKCGAKTKAGTPCKAKPVNGKKRCRLHGGLSTGAPKGNKNSLRHGMYSRVFTDGQLDEAIEMEGTISRELAIARLQLVSCIRHRQTIGDTPELDEIKDETLATEEDEEVTKKARARDADRCGEYYDPDDDYDNPRREESEPLKRTRTYKRRDWAAEENRLITLIAKLEMQLIKQKIASLDLDLKAKAAEIIKRKEGRNNEETMTDDELNAELERLLKSQ